MNQSVPRLMGLSHCDNFTVYRSTVENPVGPAAKAAYAASPISEIPTGGFNVPGGLTFASPGNREIYQNNTHLFSPRAGFAWSPDLLKGKTVIRGGFGLFVSPVTVANLAITGAYSSSPIVDQEGFSQITQFPIPSTFQTPITTMDDSDWGSVRVLREAGWIAHPTRRATI